MSRRHKHILLPVSELTGTLRNQIIARLKNYGQNENALFKQDTAQTIAVYTRKSDNERFVLLSFLQKPSFIPARFREIAMGFDKILIHNEMLDFVNGETFKRDADI